MAAARRAWTDKALPHAVAPEADPNATSSSSSLPPPNGSRWRSFVSAVGGVAYLGATLLVSVRFLYTSSVHLANDFFWSDLNVTGAGAFVALAFNTLSRRGLDNSSNGNSSHGVVVDLTSPMLASAAATDDLQLIRFSPHYARFVQFNRLTSVENGIASLRQTPVEQLLWVCTQYCWVDFDRRWSMAHTAARAERCERSYATNGAVYLEGVLRNTGLDMMMAAWGPELTIGIATPLQELPGGAEFIEAWRSHTIMPLEQEVAYWRNKGITQFKLQYNNNVQIGVDDRIVIMSALGVTSALTIKHIDYVVRAASQTTNKMFWGAANDFWALDEGNTKIAGMSLVRNTSQFFERVGISMEQVHLNDGQLPSPLTPQDQLFRAAVGPFGSIDMFWTAVPSSVVDLQQRMFDIVNRIVLSSSEARVSFLSITERRWMYYSPRVWVTPNVMAVLCAVDRPT